MGSVSASTTSTSTEILSLLVDYTQVRATTVAICDPLAAEDYVVQSMPDVSPTKWHLAHTTWFFERFLLMDTVPQYRPFDVRYDYLFNSYYESIGARHTRAERGLLSRPTVSDLRAYRSHVDQQMHVLLRGRGAEEEIRNLVVLGLNHEQQHQELMLTDLKHVFSCNPMLPVYRAPRSEVVNAESSTLAFIEFPGGIHEIGTNGEDFHFDNESPRHRCFLNSFALADRPITNGEYLEFILDRGYERAELWLSDGWAHINRERWTRPLYWSASLDSEFTLAGEQALQLSRPVVHISYYEADAFARWANARLPTEAEWEVAARNVPVSGNLLERDRLHPEHAGSSLGLKQMFGDVWEWTSSNYGAYPGYQPAAGSLGEYNGKFMCNQFVLRGGSCATPGKHIRSTYRNFFYPHARWQFMGVRLARNI